jgi:hypothetical protein
MLAYFANNHLMISDTLGNSREVAPIQQGLYPIRAEWASAGEFAVCLEDRDRRDSALFRMVVYDVATGAERVVDEYYWTQWSHLPGHTQFTGPYVTVEGEAYYVKTVITGLEEGDPIQVRRSREFHSERLPLTSSRSATQALASSHLQVWGKDGLYIVDWSGTDSTLLWQKTVPASFRMWTAVSKDKRYVFNGGKLIDCNSGDLLNVGDFAGAPPEGTQGCGFGFPSFNPHGGEILFQHYCEGGDTLVIDRIATFDYNERVFNLLDTTVSITGGSFPVYAPNGRIIAVLAHFKAYLIWREEVK